MHEFLLEWVAAWTRALLFPLVYPFEQPAIHDEMFCVDEACDECSPVIEGTVTGRIPAEPRIRRLELVGAELPMHSEADNCPTCSADYRQLELRLAGLMLAEHYDTEEQREKDEELWQDRLAEGMEAACPPGQA